MCRSCAEHAASGRSRRRCTDPASAAGAARSNYAVKTIERMPPEAVEPEPSVPNQSVELAALRGQIAEALRGSQEVAARADLERTYGSMDLAVAAAGALVQARAEQIAGITGEELKAAHDRRVAESLARYEAAKESLAAAGRAGGAVPLETLDELEEARDAHKTAKAGTDEATAEELRRLIEGRVAALEEIQPMGGAHNVVPTSDPEVAAAIGDAARCYPTSWLEISRSGRPILATLSGGENGFYMDTQYALSPTGTQRVLVEEIPDSDFPLPPDPWRSEHRFTGEIGRRGNKLYACETWLVAKETTERDASGKPTSNERWEMWTDPSSGEVHWRYPELEEVTVSEINVGRVNPSNVAGMSGLHPIAVHEQAHRFEGVINDITELENLFLTRRTTLPDGTQEPAHGYLGECDVRPDHFSDKYTGRTPYPDGSTEIFSTGVEAVFGGQYGAFLGIGGRLPDPELQNFVLGVLVSCDGKRADY